MNFGKFEIGFKIYLTLGNFNELNSLNFGEFEMKFIDFKKFRLISFKFLNMEISMRYHN
jgi:hypothetical protein